MSSDKNLGEMTIHFSKVVDIYMEYMRKLERN
jgi:hypothetical protein